MDGWMGVLEAFYFLLEKKEKFDDDERGLVWFRVGEVGVGEEEGEGEGGWMDASALWGVWRGFYVRLGNKDGCRVYVLIALIEACLEVNVQCERGRDL